MRFAPLALVLLLTAACDTKPAPDTTTPPPGADAGAAPGDSADCPAPDDPCMNADNHAECVAKSEECPGKVIRLESCPLQFACE